MITWLYSKCLLADNDSGYKVFIRKLNESNENSRISNLSQQCSEVAILSKYIFTFTSWYCAFMSNPKLERKLCLAKNSPEPVFDLSDCSLKHVPNGIFAVIKVLRKEFFYLQNNKLSSMKEGGNICDLSLLKLLDLSSNKITKLSPDIKHLKNLQVLRIDSNELTSLPVEIGSLCNLEHLSVALNDLKTLPDSLGNLRKLQYLDLRKNLNLHSLPATICQNKRLTTLLLDDGLQWVCPPGAVIREGTASILSYLAQLCLESDLFDSAAADMEDVIVSNTSETLHQLKLYDKSIQDNLQKQEKEKEKKLLQNIRAEKNISDLREKELMLCRQNESEKQKFLEDLTAQRRRLNDEVLRCQKEREEEQNRFIVQLQSVEKAADAVINQLIRTNSTRKLKYVSSLISSLTENIPVKENLSRQKVFESMEKLLAEEYLLLKRLNENNIARQNLINASSLNESQFANKLADLLCQRKNEQNSLLNGIKQDADLQYAAVLMLIEKSDYRNIELHNQIAVIQHQLSNLTALELQNRSMHINKHINELSKRRLALSELLQDIFAQQQSYREQLIEELKEVENRHSSENKGEYWLLQYQRLLNKNRNHISNAMMNVDPSLVYELALSGVSHFIPLLSTLDLQSGEGISRISDSDLKKVGIKSAEDRCAIIKAINHFIDEQHCSHIIPSAPPLESSSISPTAPVVEESAGSKSVSSLNETMQNECVICMERQWNIVFLPCGHLCSCSCCSNGIKNCPLCRCDIQNQMQIFTV